MLGRKLEVKVVKDTKSNDPEITLPTITTEEIVHHVRELTWVASKWIAIGVAGYVVLDTLRQISVNAAPHN